MSATFEKPGRAMITWALALAVGYVAVVGVNMVQHGQVEDLRRISPWTYVKQAQALRAKNDVVGALAMLEQAAALDRNNYEVFEQIGLIQYERKKWAEALEAYRKAVEVGSQKPDTRGKILWCLIHMGRYLEAAQYGEESLEAGIATPKFPRDIGDAYLRLGLRQGSEADERRVLEKARPYLEEGLRRAPRDMRLMDWLVTLYQRLGEQEKAEAMKGRIAETEGT